MPAQGEASYSGDPGATDVDLLRHLTGDTGFDGTWWLSDGEVRFEIARWVDPITAAERVYTAAAAAVRTIMARVAQRVDVVDGDAQARLATQMENFAKLVVELDRQAEAVDGLAPYSPVPTLAGRTADDDGPYFRVGMHDSPQLPSNHVHNDERPHDRFGTFEDFPR